MIINFLFFSTFQKNFFINKYLQDRPDGIRKVHQLTAYQAGGIGFALTLFFIFFFYFFFNFQLIPKNNFFILQNYQIVTLLFLTFLLGMLDDIFNIKYYLKFILLIVLNLIAINSQEYLIIEKINLSIMSNAIELKSYSLCFTLLCILLFVNALNMFDGINLQSGIYILTIFIFLIIKRIELNIYLPLLITLFFFIYKNAKGKIFLGDSGTLLISAVISYSLIAGYNERKILYADEIFIFMIIPGLDMFRLFIVRIFNKKNPFKADRNHIHHIILDFTRSSNRTALIVFIIYFIPQLLYYFNLPNLYSVLIGIFLYICAYFYFKNSAILGNRR